MFWKHCKQIVCKAVRRALCSVPICIFTPESLLGTSCNEIKRFQRDSLTFFRWNANVIISSSEIVRAKFFRI